MGDLDPANKPSLQPPRNILFLALCTSFVDVLQSEIGSKCFAVLDKKASSGLASTWTNFED